MHLLHRASPRSRRPTPSACRASRCTTCSAARCLLWRIVRCAAGSSGCHCDARRPLASPVGSLDHAGHQVPQQRLHVSHLPGHSQGAPKALWSAYAHALLSGDHDRHGLYAPLLWRVHRHMSPPVQQGVPHLPHQMRIQGGEACVRRTVCWFTCCVS